MIGIIYTVCLISFLFPMAITIRIWYQFQSPLAKNFCLLNGSMAMFSSVLMSNYFFLHWFPALTLPSEIAYSNAFFILYVAMLWMFTRVLFELFQQRWGGWRRWGALTLSLLGLLLPLTVNAGFLQWEDRVYALRFTLNGIFLPLYFIWILTLFVYLFRKLNLIRDEWKNKTAKGFAVIFLAGTPLYFIDAMWPLFQEQLHWIPRAFNTHIFIFIAWNVYSTVRWLQFLKISLNEQKFTTNPTPIMLSLPESWKDILTKREVELIEHLINHKSNQEIAESISIRLGTVKNHIYNIFNKTGVSSRKELIRMASKQAS